MITIASIQRAVAQELGTDFATMREPFPLGDRDANKNPATVAHARQAAMALSYMLTNHNLSRIGYYFGGRDRKTVYYAIRKVAERRKRDAGLHQAMRRVTLDLVRP